MLPASVVVCVFKQDNKVLERAESPIPVEGGPSCVPRPHQVAIGRTRACFARSEMGQRSYRASCGALLTNGRKSSRLPLNISGSGSFSDFIGVAGVVGFVGVVEFVGCRGVRGSVDVSLELLNLAP